MASLTTKSPCDHLSNLLNSNQVWHNYKKWHLTFLTKHTRNFTKECIELNFCPQCGKTLGVIAEK